MADIELVICISQEDYKAIKCGNIVGDMTIPFVFEAIRNGIPLPKGHGRLIDVRQIITEDECIWNNDGSCTTITTYNIDSTPTIIEADKESEE